MSLFRITLVCALAVVAVSAHAQEPQTGTGTTASGTTLTLEERIDVLSQSAQGFTRGTIEIPPQKATDYASDIRHLRSRLAEHRTECQAAIRRSNRDTKMPTVLRCQRGSLMQELTILRKQRAFTASLPAVPEDVRASYLSAVDALQDAMLTIVDAIDAKLYVTIEDMQDTKRKLYEQYRVPVWSASIRVRSTHEQVWLGIMAKHLSLLLPEALEGTERRAMEGALVCLESQGAFLGSIEAEISYGNLKSIFGQYQSGRQECIKKLRDVSRLLRPPDPSPAQGS